MEKWSTSNNLFLDEKLLKSNEFDFVQKLLNFNVDGDSIDFEIYWKLVKHDFNRLHFWLKEKIIPIFGKNRYVPIFNRNFIYFNVDRKSIYFKFSEKSVYLDFNAKSIFFDIIKLLWHSVIILTILCFSNEISRYSVIFGGISVTFWAGILLTFWNSV